MSLLTRGILVTLAYFHDIDFCKYIDPNISILGILNTRHNPSIHFLCSLNNVWLRLISWDLFPPRRAIVFNHPDLLDKSLELESDQNSRSLRRSRLELITVDRLIAKYDLEPTGALELRITPVIQFIARDFADCSVADLKIEALIQFEL